MDYGDEQPPAVDPVFASHGVYERLIASVHRANVLEQRANWLAELAAERERRISGDQGGETG